VNLTGMAFSPTLFARSLLTLAEATQTAEKGFEIEWTKPSDGRVLDSENP